MLLPTNFRETEELPERKFHIEEISLSYAIPYKLSQLINNFFVGEEGCELSNRIKQSTETEM